MERHPEAMRGLLTARDYGVEEDETGEEEVRREEEKSKEPDPGGPTRMLLILSPRSSSLPRHRIPSLPLSLSRGLGLQLEPQPEVEEEDEKTEGKGKSKDKGKGKARQKDLEEDEMDEKDEREEKEGDEDVDSDIRAAIEESARMAAAGRAGRYGGGEAGPSSRPGESSTAAANILLETAAQPPLSPPTTDNPPQTDAAQDTPRIIMAPDHHERIEAFNQWREYRLTHGYPDPAIARNSYLNSSSTPPDLPTIPSNPESPTLDPSYEVEHIEDAYAPSPDEEGLPPGVPMVNRRAGAGVGDDEDVDQNTLDAQKAPDLQSELYQELEAEDKMDEQVAVNVQYWMYVQEKGVGEGEEPDLETQVKRGEQGRAREAVEAEGFKDNTKEAREPRALVDEIKLWDSGTRTTTLQDVARALLDLCALPEDHPRYHHRLAILARAVGVLSPSQTYGPTSTPDYDRILLRTLLTLLQDYSSTRGPPTLRLSVLDPPPDILWLFLYTANPTLQDYLSRLLVVFDNAECGETLTQRSMILDLLEWALAYLPRRAPGWAARQVEAFRAGGMRLPEVPGDGMLGSSMVMVDDGMRPRRACLTIEAAEALRARRKAAFRAVRYNAPQP
ncbi:hypothetical protein IAT38_004283 [Cryptococcus sp. DSM 104549]